MNTIFDNLNGNVDLSIFGKSNTDPKTPLRRHYLSLVGLLEYVDILNGDLTGRNLPAGITEETVKGMIIHSIGDLDTMKAMSAGGGSELEYYVDLGLPSGTLWATCNIGAKLPEETGLYFAWGETHGYTAEQVGVDKDFLFSWEDYVFGNPQSKYNETDGKTELESGDDAATVNLDLNWRMPTKEQFQELIDNTDQEWTEINGVKGTKLTSKVDENKFVFFPAVGYAENSKVDNVGDIGFYWSVSLKDDEISNAWFFGFDTEMQSVDKYFRYCGCPIRPVSSHKYINLGLPSGTLWATENIKDANGNELYFAWGETQGYTAEQVGVDKNFTWDGENNDYAFGPFDRDDQTNFGMKKYNKTDGITELESKDDAATVNWGKGWKMPTEEQFQELLDNTNHEWVEIDGVPGAKLTSKVEGYTDKFLFFPAVGNAVDGEVYDVGDSGCCWSASLDGGFVGSARYFGSNGDFGLYRMDSFSRYVGDSVRPVRLQNQ